MEIKRQQPDVVVLSDIHLGTVGCHAKEVLEYLNSISPRILILNGDIIDIWNFRKRYFPKNHLQVLRKLLEMSSKGIKVYYLTGNHDELLRKFADFSTGGLYLKNKLVLKLGKKKAWIFHGDVFDVSIQNAKWIAKLGGMGYDLLILLNRYVNKALEKLGKEPYSLSKKIKNSVKKAVKYISDFENTASELAIDQGYDYVICGHIHQPQMREVTNKKGSTLYLNSGDWIENLSALEYTNGQWSIYHHPVNNITLTEESEDWQELTAESLFQKIMVNTDNAAVEV